MKYYHGTTRLALKKILKSGFLLRGYVTTTRAYAEHWAHEKGMEDGSEAVVLSLKTVSRSLKKNVGLAK